MLMGKRSFGMPFLRFDLIKMVGASLCLTAWLLLKVPSGAAELNRESRLTQLPGLPEAEQPVRGGAFARGLSALQVRDYSEALVQFEGAAAGARIESTPHCWLSAQFQTCHVLNLLGRRADAIRRARAVVADCEEVLGAEDPITSDALHHLATLLKHNGSLAEAEPVYARNLAGLVDKHGADSLFAARARTRLANLLMLVGRMDEAEDHHRKALAAAQTSLGDEHADNCFFLTHLAYCLHIIGRKKTEAGSLMGKAYGMLQQDHQLDASSLGSILRRQAEFFRDTRQLEKARLAGRQCLTRLAAMDEAHRDRFFYYDKVRELYQSILEADGLKPGQIKIHLAEVENGAREER